MENKDNNQVENDGNNEQLISIIYNKQLINMEHKDTEVNQSKKDGNDERKKIFKKYSNNIITFKKRFIRIINIMILITVISIIMNINEIVINQLTNNNFISLNCMDTKICNREKKFHYPNFFVKGYTVNNIQNNKALQSKKENIESIMSNFEESIKDYKNHSVNRFTIKSYFDDKLSNVNIIDCNGNTPLVYAVKNQSLPIVEV